MPIRIKKKKYTWYDTTEENANFFYIYTQIIIGHALHWKELCSVKIYLLF
jgi:hypothetical protein